MDLNLDLHAFPMLLIIDRIKADEIFLAISLHKKNNDCKKPGFYSLRNTTPAVHLKHSFMHSANLYQELSLCQRWIIKIEKALIIWEP